MIISQTERQTYLEAGKITTEILAHVRDKVKVGVTPYELDQQAFRSCDRYGVRSAFKDVTNKNGPYGYAMCISVNDTVLHGIPSKDVYLKRGDVVKLDFGVIYQGMYTDMCVTVGVEHLSKKNKKLVETTKNSVLEAVNLAIAGNTTGDLGYAMESNARKQGYNVLKEYIGHGIGKHLHESPAIPAYGQRGHGDVLKDGMVVCIEAQVVAGSAQVYTTQDSWTVKTMDGRNSAMFEYLVIVDRDRPQILTDTIDWPLVVG